MNNFFDKSSLEVGIDESGAGPLAGPLYAAGVILPTECPDDEYIDLWNMINDSKKVSPKKREMLYDYIKFVAIDYSIVSIDEKVIDDINILQARFKAYHKLIDELNIKPSLILMDGDKFKEYPGIPHKCILKGDTKYKNIAAASILAKVERDKYMIDLHEKYPLYLWNSNKGYGSKQHINAIKENGLTPYHRRSFCKNFV